jgi:hypothetical protein
VAEVFSASFTPRLRAVKLGAVGADYGQFVNSASIDSRFPALRITQIHSLPVVLASQGHTVAAPSLAVSNTPLGVANAQTIPEVASYEIGAKPVGQWTVGTDFVAATASTTELVHLQQNLLNFRFAASFYGFQTTSPDFNQTLAATNIDPASPTAGHTATPVVFTQSDQALTVVAAETGHTVVAPGYGANNVSVAVAQATMGHAVIDFTQLNPGVNLDQAQNMGVANANGVCEVAAPTLFLIPNVPTPAIRIFTPAAESRTYGVVTESRSFAIAA